MSRYYVGNGHEQKKNLRANKPRVSVKTSIKFLAAPVDLRDFATRDLILATGPKFGPAAVGPSPSKRELETFVVVRTS
jgi:hypothetical protein